MSRDSLGGWYKQKSARYYGGARADWLETLSARSGMRILEIGCGDGSTGEAALQDGIASYYCGVELMSEPAGEARQRLSEVVEGNIEQVALPWDKLSFDAVFASEVLEHLIDPWQCVDRLAGLLKPGGIFLASSPNVCHHKIIRQLVAGRFDLRETGPMDRTHLRWFTPSTYRQMFEAAGLRVDQLGPVGPPGPKSKALGLLLPPKQKVCLWVQINIRAVKPGNSST